MKPHRSNPLFPAFLRRSSFTTAIVVGLAGLASHQSASAAAQVYQDANIANVWDTTTANWDAGVAWANGNTATFGGTGESVTVNAVTANGITFSSSGYTLTGGTLTLGSAPTTISAASDATIISAIAGGTNGLSKSGAGTLTLGGAQSYTGNFTLNGGGNAVFASGFVLNNTTTNVSLVGTSANSKLAIEAGSVLNVKYIGLGDSGGSQSGRVDQSGGLVTVNTSGNNFRVGHWDNGSSAGSVYNLSGGILDTRSATATISHDGAGDVNVGGGAGSATWQTGLLNFDAGGGDTRVGRLTLLSNGVLEANDTIGASNSGAALEGIHFAGGTAKVMATKTWNAAVYADASSTLNANGFTLTLTGSVNGTSAINLPSATGSISFSTTGTQTVAASFTGSTALAKTGAGTTVLSGASTTTGAMTVSAGTLSLTGSLASPTTVASGATLSGEGTLSGSLTPASGSFIQIDPTTAGALTVGGLNLTAQPTLRFTSTLNQAMGPVKLFTYTGTLTSPGGLATDLKGLSGYNNPVITDTAGVVTLAVSTQNLTWGGPAAVWDLKTSANWSNSGSQQFAWGDGVLFDDTVGVPTTITLSGELMPSSITVNSSANNYTITGSAGNFISGTTSLVKSGTSTLTLGGPNTFTGGVIVNGGVLKIGSATALGAYQTGRPVTQVVVAGGGTVDFNGIADATYGYTIAGTGAVGTGALINTGAAIGNGSAQASNIKLSANASIGGTGNWSLLTNGYGATSLDLGGYSLSKVGSNTIYLCNSTVTAGSISVDAGTLATVQTASNASAASLSLANVTGAGLSLGVNLSVGSLAGGGALGGNVALGANTLTTGALNTSTAYAGGISGTGALTKTGTGTQVLSGANTYTGVTTVSSGVLQFGKPLSLYNNTTASWTPANIKVSSGATLAMNVGGAGEFASGDVTTLLANLSAISSNGLQAGSIVGFDTSNTVGGSFTLSNVIANSSGTGSGAVGVRKLGAGTLVLSGASTYTGGTTVNSGTLEVTGNASGSAKFYTVAQGASLRFGYSTSVGFGYNCGVTVNGSGTGDSSGLYLSGGQSMQFGGTLTLQTQPSTVRTYGAGNATLNGGDVNYAYLSVPATGSGSVIDSTVNIACSSYGYRLSTIAGANTATGDLTINGVISGSGSNSNGGPFATSLRKEGSGSVLLTAANTYGNGVYIGGGSVIVGGGNNRLPAAAGVILNSGTYLRLNGISQTVSKVANAGTGGSVVGNAASLSTLTISDSADATLNTRLGGSGTNEDNLALGKSGAGILTLANPSNSHAGGTTINGGTLRVLDFSGSSAGTGPITVNSGGTLDGYGTVAVDVTVSPTGGTVAGGIGAGSLQGDYLTVDNLTFQGTGAISVIPNVTQIAVTNTLTTSGAAGSVAVNIGTTPISPGTYTLVTHSGAIAGTGVTAFTIGTNPGGPFNYLLSDNGGELQLTVTTSALFWNGDNGPEWSTFNNWKTGSGSSVSFSAGSAVVFNDDASSLVVDLNTADVAPGSVTFSNSAGYDYTLGGSKAITGTSALLKSGTGIVTIDNINAFTGDVTINQGTLNAASIANAGSDSSIGKGSAITLGGGALGYTGLSAAATDRPVSITAASALDVNAGDLSLDGVVGGSGALTKSGTGTLALTNAGNSLAGALSVTGGAVLVDDVAKLGSGSLTLAGGTLALTGSSAITTAKAITLGAGGGTLNVTNAAGVTHSGAITGTSGLTKNGPGTLTLTTNKNFTGGVTVNNGTLYIGAGGWYTIPFGGVNTLTINSGGTVETAGAHSLGTDQTPVVINGGTLKLGREQYATNLQMTGGLVTGNVDPGAELRNWGGTMVFHASPTSAVIATRFNLVGNAILNVEDGSAAEDLLISGPIIGSSNLTKSGDGKLSLQGSNTYTGGTTVNAGTLELRDNARLTFVIPASGTSNKLSGAGTAALDGDFHINLTAASALSSGSWTIEDMTGAATYGSSFQVVESDGTPWSVSGDKWTKVSGSQTWTFDEATGILSLTQAGYSGWESANGITGAGAVTDSDGDGIPNGIEFVIGGDPSGPNSDSNALQPTLALDATYLNFTFRRTDASAAYDPFVEYGSTLSGWTPAEGGVSGVIINETADFYGTGIDQVVVRIPRSLAVGAKLFARLRVDITP